MKDTANAQERLRGKRQSEVSCSTVSTTVSACATALSDVSFQIYLCKNTILFIQSPASTIVQTACSITVTVTVTCTTAEIATIQSDLDTAAAAVVSIEVFIAAVQAELEGK